MAQKSVGNLIKMTPSNISCYFVFPDLKKKKKEIQKKEEFRKKFRIIL